MDYDNMFLFDDKIEDDNGRETLRPNTKQSLPLIQDNSTRSSVLSGLIENEQQQQDPEAIINEDNFMYGNDSIFNENILNDHNISYGEDSIIKPEEYIGDIISDVPVIMPTKRVSSNAIEILPKRIKSIFDKKTELATAEMKKLINDPSSLLRTPDSLKRKQNKSSANSIEKKNPYMSSIINISKRFCEANGDDADDDNLPWLTPVKQDNHTQFNDKTNENINENDIFQPDDFAFTLPDTTLMNDVENANIDKIIDIPYNDIENRLFDAVKSSKQLSFSKYTNGMNKLSAAQTFLCLLTLCAKGKIDSYQSNFDIIMN